MQTHTQQHPNSNSGRNLGTAPEIWRVNHIGQGFQTPAYQRSSQERKMLVSGQHKPPLATLCIQPRPPPPRPQVLKSWDCYFFPFLWLTFTFSGPFSWLYHLVEYYSIFWLSISQLDPMTASKFHLTLEDWLLGQRDHQIVRSRLEQQPVFSLLSLS